jgi:hypothetical protein
MEFMRRFFIFLSMEMTESILAMENQPRTFPSLKGTRISCDELLRPALPLRLHRMFFGLIRLAFHTIEI